MPALRVASPSSVFADDMGQYFTKGAASLCGVVELINEDFSDEAIQKQVEDRLMPRTEEFPIYDMREFNDKVAVWYGPAWAVLCCVVLCGVAFVVFSPLPSSGLPFLFYACFPLLRLTRKRHRPSKHQHSYISLGTFPPETCYAHKSSWAMVLRDVCLPGFPLTQILNGRCWVIVDGAVLDVSTFAKRHPGGARIIINAMGTDVTAEFLGESASIGNSRSAFAPHAHTDVSRGSMLHDTRTS